MVPLHTYVYNGGNLNKLALLHVFVCVYNILHSLKYADPQKIDVYQNFEVMAVKILSVKVTVTDDINVTALFVHPNKLYRKYVFQNPFFFIITIGNSIENRGRHNSRNTT